MSCLQGKNILVGISGGIAAYKSPFLIRNLIQKGCNVKVVVTENALQFVTITTLQTVSTHSVYYNMFEPYKEQATEHISLSDWADIFVVAPATANIIGKYATGIADDALTTSLLAFDKPVFLAPAMNNKMYNNYIVQKNINILKSLGVHIIEPSEGFLACGTTGKGRMADIEVIIQAIENSFLNTDFSNKKITINAGPTREQIDSVRFISNNSSGKMGIALAEVFVKYGANVDLILGPVSQSVLIKENPNLHIINVISAEDMYKATLNSANSSDIIICAAAVADYTIDNKFEGKMKKNADNLVLNLVPTKDILAELGKRKKSSQVLVGFALETDNELENAKKKLNNKNLDFIVLNSLRDKGAGFDVDTNKVIIINKNDDIIDLPLKSKKDLAKDIINLIKEFL